MLYVGQSKSKAAVIFAVDILTSTRDEGFGVLATVAEACWDGGVNTVCPLEVKLGIKYVSPSNTPSRRCSVWKMAGILLP